MKTKSFSFTSGGARPEGVTGSLRKPIPRLFPVVKRKLPAKKSPPKLVENKGCAPTHRVPPPALGPRAATKAATWPELPSRGPVQRGTPNHNLGSRTLRALLLVWGHTHCGQFFAVLGSHPHQHCFLGLQDFLFITVFLFFWHAFLPKSPSTAKKKYSELCFNPPKKGESSGTRRSMPC